MSRKKILFYVHVSSHLKASLKFIQLLQINVNYEPVVFLNSGGGWNLTKDLNFCTQNGIRYILDSESERFFASMPELSTVPPAAPYFSPEQKAQSYGAKDCIKNFLKRKFSMLVFWNYCRKRIKEFKVLLELNQIYVVILPEDSYEIL